MTDLLERLRAVNPVPTCDPPILEDVWRKLEHEDRGPGRDTPRRERRRRIGVFSGARLRVRHAGLGLAVAVPLLVAVLAIGLLGHNQSRQPATQTGPAHHGPASRDPSRTDASSSSIVAALARGVHPRAPDAGMPLPILGSSGTRTLNSFRGKVVVLNVFASWCLLCKNETATLEQAQTHILGQRATVLGVTYLDKSAAAQAFVRAGHITYPVLRDVTGRFVRSFGAYAVPETFVIDQLGRVVAARVGPMSRRWLTQILSPACFPTAAPASRVTSACRPNLPPTASELAAMTKAYPVLDHPQQPIDIPAYGVLDPYVISQGGLLANSRRAVVTSHGESLYIVPAHQAICVVSSDNVVQGCQQFPYTTRTPADISASFCSPNLPATELEVAGLMPPKASDIKAHYSNGSSQPVRAVNGMIAIYAPLKGAVPRSITWTSPSGPEHTGTAVPPNVASSKCAS
jgi:cytochrome c biogenesis protein CcmG, thiol:disulfide interchange protein DsbE